MRSKDSAWRAAFSAGLVIALLNLFVLQAGRLLGADMLVAQSPKATPTEIGAATVVLMSVAPTVLGGLVLWLAARRYERAWRTIGWLGLALGLLTVPMPFAVEASTGTSATLGSMHVVAGLVWIAAMHRAGRREHSAARMPHAA